MAVEFADFPRHPGEDTSAYYERVQRLQDAAWHKQLEAHGQLPEQRHVWGWADKFRDRDPRYERL